MTIQAISGQPSEKLARQMLAQFLERYCPKSSLLLSEIDQLGLWNIQELGPDEVLCSAEERADTCWIVLSGQVEIRYDGNSIRFRSPGEMIGEQAFLVTLGGKEVGYRTADMIARGDLKLLGLDASLQERLSPEAQAEWGLTLALVINEKLVQATHQRSDFRDAVSERDALIARFAEGEALGIVRRAMDDGSAPVDRREVVIWFSDIANFSSWAATKSPEEVARIARALSTLQVDQIRGAEGQLDKLLGDGVMAYWFVDTEERQDRLPAMALECAWKVVDDITAFLKSESLEDSLGIRIGIHSGHACFGDFGAQGRIAVTILGHDVNLASRYEQARSQELSSVRVSPALKELVDSSGSCQQWEFGEVIREVVKHGVIIEIYSPKKGKLK